MTVKQLIAKLREAFNEDAEVIIWTDGGKQRTIERVITYLDNKVFIDIVKDN